MSDLPLSRLPADRLRRRVLDYFTPKERAVLLLRWSGMTNRQVAAASIARQLTPPSACRPPASACASTAPGVALPPGPSSRPCCSPNAAAQMDNAPLDGLVRRDEMAGLIAQISRDGRDFLLWQRGQSPQGAVVADLERWKAELFCHFSQ